MIKDGVLYTVADKGYILSVYPMAKTDTVFEVAEGTVKIEYSAACDNKSLERVVLPESLRFIGNYAFYGCTNLDTIVFKSYYAPVLEGSINEAVEITPDNVSDFPGFDKLYKYDYYYKFEGTVLYTYYYHQFVDIISSQNANALTYVIPKNSKGYDSKLYAAYFTLSETEDAGVVTGPYAWAFIDAVNNLPNNRDVDRFDEALINAAINAYNALIGKAEEKAFVADSYFEKFAKARSQYNVSVVDNKIAHLFDMDNSKYSYELVKEARGLYLALTDAERESLADGARLEAKIAELALAMGVELDFTKTYEEHFPKQDLPSDDGADQTTEKSDKWIVIVIVAVVVVLAACGAGALVVANRKKKSALAEVSETAEEAANYDENTNVDGVQSEVEISDEGAIDTDTKED
jgi:hypothetical protein